MNKQQKIELLENELHILENRILDLLKELQRKDNIINELEKDIKVLLTEAKELKRGEPYASPQRYAYEEDIIVYEYLLDKLKELKEK